MRVWVVLTILVGGSLGYLVASNFKDGLAERQMIRGGATADARIVDIDGDRDPRKVVSMHGSVADRTVRLIYKDTNGKEIESVRPLENVRYNDAHVGDIVAIHFDPQRPEAWTDRVDPQPWLARLFVVWMLLPALLIAIAMMLLRRSQILSIWTEGVPLTGTVIDIRQSAIAPRSRVVRFTLAESADRRVHSTFFPLAAGDIGKGDELIVLASPTNHARTIAAELYEEIHH